MRFTLGFLILIQAFGQTSPDAAALLTRSADELQRYRSYQLTQETAMDINAPGMAMPPMAYTTMMQVVNPGKLRMEMKTSGIDGMLAVSDGANSWMYMPMLKQYSKMPLDESGPQSIMSGMAAALPDMKVMTANANVLRSELIEVDGQQRDCWVIESRVDTVVPPTQPGTKMENVVFTTWIDKTLGIQLKTSFSSKTKTAGAASAVDTKMTTTTRSMKFNLDLPDSLFVFTPPAGATETAELFPGMNAARPGPAAPAAAPKPPAPGEPEAFLPMLRPVNRIEPVYPPEARTQGVQGLVDLLVTIDASGAVVNAEPLDGHDLLRPAAVQAVRQWKFRPVFRNGRPVPALTQAVVDFFPDTGKPASPEDLNISEQVKSAQRFQELAAKFPRSPAETLADSEEQIRGADESDRFATLPDLSKQALAAGDLSKASSYATELLSS